MRPFQRGAVVVRDGCYAVVWADDARGLELFEIVQPEHHHAGDVLLDRGLDLMAFAISLPGAVVRPSRIPSTGDGYVAVGTLPGERMCEVVRGLLRVENEAYLARKWHGDATHQQRGRENART